VTPLLSIVVSSHNHARSLPALLESIARQSLKDLEVVVVDDASEVSCENMVAAYGEKGLDIRLHSSSARMYTKDARLKGIELARGEIIAFADADDEFVGSDILERHVGRYLDSGCDALHFCTMRMHAGEGAWTYNAWADPFAAELKGEDIFREYVKTLAGHPVWNKLYSRELWMRHIEAARAVPVTVCSEDLFLSTFYLFHARHYVGSELVGYAHDFADKTAAKSACRAAAFFIMIQDFLPYLEANGCPPDCLERLGARLGGDCRAYAGRACLEAMKDGGQGLRLREAADAFQGLSEDRLIDLLIYANGWNAGDLSARARDFLR
jgi:glycosyltransferase involved in cell wall biosynthesis